MRKATDYLDQYDIPWRRWVSEGTPPTWDGAVLTLDWREQGDTHPSHVEWAFHEISHHLFAPPASRKLPNYGLGPDPGGGGHSEVVKGASRGRDPDEDESAVCVLDIVLMLEHGLPTSFIEYHAQNYNIDGVSTRDFELLGAIGVGEARVQPVVALLQALISQDVQ